MDDQLAGRPEHQPVYNIKAVSRLTGLLPVTLRAWERRYGLPSPHRGEQGYRLYSEHDLHTLRWLKSQLDTGLSISRAAEHLTELRAAGRDPAEELFGAQPVDLPNGTAALTQVLLDRLMRFDETGAMDALRRGFALYSIDTVLVEIVQPALVAIGEAWHRGELPIAVEHFASQLFMQHLMGMLAASAPPHRSGMILAACAPGEFHQIGLLMLVVMLRWRGWDVRYLGPDLHLDRLLQVLAALKPRALLFSATRPESAQALAEIPAVLAQLPHPPRLVVGGQAFSLFPPLEGALYLNNTPQEMVVAVERLVQ